jgi:hypothetical protein
MDGNAAMAATMPRAMPAMMTLRDGGSGEHDCSREDRSGDQALSKHRDSPQPSWTTLETVPELGKARVSKPAPSAPLVPDEAADFVRLPATRGPAS